MTRGRGESSPARRKAAAHRRNETDAANYEALQGVLLQWVRDGKPPSEWRFRELTDAAVVSRSTLRRRGITRTEQVAARVVDRMEHDPSFPEIPSVLRKQAGLLAEPHLWVREYLSGETQFGVARTSNVEVARARYKKVGDNGNNLVTMVAAAILGHSLLTFAQREYRRAKTLQGIRHLDNGLRSQRQERADDAQKAFAEVDELLEEAAAYCSTALGLVDTDDRRTLEAALRCLPTAVEAERLLSRRSGNKGRLLRIMEFKRRELQYAEILGLPARAAMAKFNMDRARALLDNDHDAEWQTVHTGARRLLGLVEKGEILHGPDIEAIYQRYLAIQVAYDRTPSSAQTSRLTELLAHHPDGRNSQFSRNAALLRKLIAFNREYAALGGVQAPPEKVNELLHKYLRQTRKAPFDLAPSLSAAFRPADLLRAHRFDGVGHLLLARYFRAIWHGSRECQGDWSPIAPRVFRTCQAKPIDFLRRSAEYCALAYTERRDEGAAGQLKRTAIEEREETLQLLESFEHELPPTSVFRMDFEHDQRHRRLDSGRDEVEQILGAVDRLVLGTAQLDITKTITQTTAHRIFEALAPLHDFYLSGPPL